MERVVNFQDIIIVPSVCETACEDGAVLLDVEQGICFGLNPVGLRIWTMLGQQRSLEQMIDALEREFHTPRPQLAADICDFVRQLEVKHLICHGVLTPPERGWLANLLLRKTGTRQS
jgi:Coenzyme PQQ synthesis protein D (PqqD)